jgi:hypothetical protein
VNDKEIQAEIEADRLFGPEERVGDDIDQAVGVLRKARRILADSGLMRRIRTRLDEDRRAVEAAAGKRD